MHIFRGTLSEHPNPSISRQLYQFRKQVFADRLGWEVSPEGDQERDGYDTEQTRWVLIEDDGELIACVRLLSCDGPYMMPDIFPSTLAGEPAPRTAQSWEMTRLAIDAERAPRFGNGVSELTLVLFRETNAYAMEHGVKELIGVASTPVERIYRRLGLPITRLGHGKPVDLGVVRGLGIRLTVGDALASAVDVPLSGHYFPYPRQPSSPLYPLTQETSSPEAKTTSRRDNRPSPQNQDGATQVG